MEGEENLRLQGTHSPTSDQEWPKMKKGCSCVGMDGVKWSYLCMEESYRDRKPKEHFVTLLRMSDSFEACYFTKAIINVDVNITYLIFLLTTIE